MQLFFNPVDYGFSWASDWYQFDSVAGHKAALVARNTKAQALKAAGYTVRCFTLRNQLITRGGIGTEHPEISLVVTSYGINAH